MKGMCTKMPENCQVTYTKGNCNQKFSFCNGISMALKVGTKNISTSYAQTSFPAHEI